MGSLGDLKARIALELLRDDIPTQIANAIYDAIDTYQSDRFYFNEPTLLNQPTFNTVVGQATYDATALADIATAGKIDYLTYIQGNSTFQITRRSPLDVQLANQGSSVTGPPDEYAYAGQAITLYPVPDAVYPVSLFGLICAPQPANDADASTPWTNDAEQLIRCRAKFEIATHITRNAAVAMMMSPEVTGGPNGGPGATFRAWSQLKGATARRVSNGVIAAMQF